MGEASEDPDLILYLEENVNSLSSADLASLLDYQVFWETTKSIHTFKRNSEFETPKQRTLENYVGKD